jgi:hypothetical protein
MAQWRGDITDARVRVRVRVRVMVRVRVRVGVGVRVKVRVSVRVRIRVRVRVRVRVRAHLHERRVHGARLDGGEQLEQEAAGAHRALAEGVDLALASRGCNGLVRPLQHVLLRHRRGLFQARDAPGRGARGAAAWREESGRIVVDRSYSRIMLGCGITHVDVRVRFGVRGVRF